MDVKDLEKFSDSVLRQLETERRLHPPQVVQVPIQLPFSIHRAITEIHGGVDGERFIRQRLQMTAEGALPRPIDAWYMREEFLSLSQRETALLKFLNKYGWWNGQNRVPVSAFWDLQEFLAWLLRGPKRLRGQQLSQNGIGGLLPGALAHKFSVSFNWNNGAPLFTTEAVSCVDAIAASVLVDLIRGARFKKCARHDCPVVFRITSRHKRKYHHESCRHLEVVRRQRKSTRKNKQREPR